MRNELIRLERLAAVIARTQLRLRLFDGRIAQMQQRRLGERKHDIDVHRDVGPQSRGADLSRKSDAAIHLHGPRIDALHLRQEGRPLLLLDQRAAHAALAEVDRKRQPGRPAADDEDFRIQ